MNNVMTIIRLLMTAAPQPVALSTDTIGTPPPTRPTKSAAMVSEQPRKFVMTAILLTTMAVQVSVSLKRMDTAIRPQSPTFATSVGTL